MDSYDGTNAYLPAIGSKGYQSLQELSDDQSSWHEQNSKQELDQLINLHL